MTNSKAIQCDSEPLRVFIGYDSTVIVAYHVLAHSILRRASVPVSITPLALNQLGGLMWRERNPLQSTDFSFSRFLTPYLAGYKGWALFMDNDMLVMSDIAKLFALRDERYAVQVVKHDYTPSSKSKFLNQPQTAYEKKNWSSVMLMNCAKCQALTPDYVNTASGLDLHRFNWLGDDALIGEIPAEWNFLVGEYAPIPVEQIHNLHYTIGGPYFEDYRDCDYADVWNAERAHMLMAELPKSKAKEPKEKELVLPKFADAKRVEAVS